MLFARDYENNEYPILAKKIVTSELNGNEDLELHIPQQKNNNLDLLSIDKLWEFDYNNIIYKAVNVKRQTRGNSFNLNVRAMPLFYWEFSKSIIHENHDGSHTANSAFRTVFDGSGFNFALVDFSPSVEIEGFGKGANRLELFKRLLDRYNYEFEIQGRTVYMKHLIGNDTNYMYKYRLNASNVSENIDASSMFTYIRGFGDFEEGEEDYFNNAGLQDDYLSPLAEIVTKPGQLPDEGPPIVDGRITQVDTLKEAMRKAVEESLAITIEGTLHDVRQMGYDIAVPVKGDRVWLHDERINLEQEIRLHKIVTTYDEKDNIIACDVTFGSQSIGERHKANINTLSKRFADLLTGKLKLPIISLEQIGMDMINAIHAASSEIIFGDFGMQAISKTNPNHVFGVNSEGWYISQDGGRTPKTIATAQGIYADALFAGTLWLTNEMNIESADGYLNVTGSRFVMRSKTSPKNAVEITPEGITVHGYDSREYFVNGIMRGQAVANLNLFNSHAVEMEGNRDIVITTDSFERVYTIYDQWRSNRLDLLMNFSLKESSPNTFRNLDVRVVDMYGGNVVYTERMNVYKNPTEGQDFKRLSIDLNNYFNTVVDYRNLHLYVEVRMMNVYTNIALFRVNKGEVYD